MTTVSWKVSWLECLFSATLGLLFIHDASLSKFVWGRQPALIYNFLRSADKGLDLSPRE